MVIVHLVDDPTPTIRAEGHSMRRKKALAQLAVAATSVALLQVVVPTTFASAQSCGGPPAAVSNGQQPQLGTPSQPTCSSTPAPTPTPSPTPTASSTSAPDDSTYSPADTTDVPIQSSSYAATDAAASAASSEGGNGPVSTDGTTPDTQGDSAAPSGTTMASSLSPNSLPWICSIYTSDPTKTVESGKQVIYGDSDQLCSGTGYSPLKTVTVVEQYRGLRIWSIKDKYSDPEEYGTNHSFASAWWYCASGTGYQKYRIIGDNYADNGQYEDSVQSEHYLSVTCPR